MTTIVFGTRGQNGYYLTRLFGRTRSNKVIGVSRSEGDWIQGQVKDRRFVEHLVRDVRPERKYHIAANSTISHAAFEHHETIVTVTV
jgi:GDP-D-mannose dehydratase